MLKRLRGSGYKADKLIGNSDPRSLEIDFEKFLDKVFPEERPFYNKDIKTVLKEFRTEFLRYTYLTNSYTEFDSRKWTIIIDGGRGNVFLTFFENSKDVDEKYESFGSDYFEIYDGDQYVKPIRKKLNTHSFEVIVKELNALGILNKFANYSNGE
jgi:hypothetical protein